MTEQKKTKIIMDDNTKNILNKLVHFTFNFDTKLNDKGEEKKDFSKMPIWRPITKDNYHNYINTEDKATGVLTGKINNLTVLDFDDMDTYNTIIDNHPELKQCYKIRTNKGYHLYFNYDPSIKSSTNVLQDYKGVDTRNDGTLVIGWGSRYKTLDGKKIVYKYEGGTIGPFPDFLKKYFKKDRLIESKEEVKVKVKEIKLVNNKMDENNNKIVELIDVKYLDDFDSWNKIVWAMKKENFDVEFIKQISKKSKSYTDEGFNNAYNKSPTDISINFGTIIYYAKLSNEEEFMKLSKINKQYDFMNFTDDTYAQIILNEIGDSFIYQTEMLYIYYKNRWYENNINLTKFVCKDFLTKYLTQQYKILMESLTIADAYEQEGISTKIKVIQNANLKVCNNKTLDNIIKMLIVGLSPRLDKVVFDALLPDVLCFDNIAINLLTGEEFIVEKKHYITQHTEYNYIKSTDQQMIIMNKIINDIFQVKEEDEIKKLINIINCDEQYDETNKQEKIKELIEINKRDIETKKTYLSIMFSSLTGHHLEKFIIATGCGRNGKSLIDELLMATLGNMYSYKGNITTLTKEMKEGANQEVALMDNKRFVLFSEPNDDKQLQLGNIKSLTGDATFNARQLWSKKTECRLVNTTLYECNKLSSINGRIDLAAIKRFILVELLQFFTDNPEELETIPGSKLQNHSYKTKEWKDEFKTVLFDYIIENAPKKLYVSKYIEKQTKEYLYSSDNFLGWFDENYIKSSEPNAYIKLDDIYTNYLKSSLYNNTPKKEKQKINKKSFKQTNIMEKENLKKYFCERKKINGKDEYSILIMYKQKTEEQCYIDDNED